MKKLVFIIMILMISQIGISQTGPGGIGKNDGTSNLDIWLSDTMKYTDAGVTLAGNGDAVQQWNDVSGNGNHAIQTISSLQAINNTNALNSFSTTEFSNDRYTISYSINPSTNSDITIIAVVDHNTALNSPYSKVFGHDDGDYDRAVGFDDRCSGQSFNYTNGNNINGISCFATPSANTPFVFSANYTANTFTGWYNGDKLVNSSTVQNGDGLTELYLGSIDNVYYEYWDGLIAEFILYSRSLNDLEQIIIQNHLAAKYGTTLSSNDKYAGDDASKGDYDYNVIGIGTESSGSHTESNDGVGLTITAVSGFGNGDYLFAGNWSKDNYSNNTDVGGPASLDARWNRIWYFDVTDAGTAYTIDISFDFSDAGISQSPGTATNYKLLWRSGQSGNWADAASSITPTVSGDKVTFSGVSLTNGEGYYTLGTYDYVGSTLPIEWLSFAVEKQDGGVSLKWQTAAEINNNFFTIEHSTDKNHWVKLAEIKSQVSSSTFHSYSYLDESPTQGTSYYRIKQTDFDGKQSYSAIRAIDYMPVSNKITVFPNPANSRIIIKGPEKELLHFIIYDALGRNVTNEIEQKSKSKNQRIVDLSNLQNGLYFIKFQSSVIKLSKAYK